MKLHEIFTRHSIIGLDHPIRERKNKLAHMYTNSHQVKFQKISSKHNTIFSTHLIIHHSSLSLNCRNPVTRTEFCPRLSLPTPPNNLSMTYIIRILANLMDPFVTSEGCKIGDNLRSQGNDVLLGEIPTKVSYSAMIKKPEVQC